MIAAARASSSSGHQMSSSSSSRPVYVPRGRRRRGGKDNKNVRFHGAFHGGFSAGHFNTVGSEQGWKPKDLDVDDNDADGRRQYNEQPSGRTGGTRSSVSGGAGSAGAGVTQQKLDDFMDEQDYEEWGGPVGVRRDYKDDNTSPKQQNQRNNSKVAPIGGGGGGSSSITTDVLWTVQEPSAAVGQRLLRVLGWRGDGNAYVPSTAQQQQQQQQGSSSNGGTSQEDTAVAGQQQHFLSSRRLRMIRLQQIRVPIPAPKLDTCGLGFERYQGAPEFQKMADRKRKRAQERGSGNAGSSSGNVYRVDDVLGGNEDDGNERGKDGRRRQQRAENSRNLNGDDDEFHDQYAAAYDTLEDFVGTKSSSGFALRADHDDTYDDEDGEGGKHNADAYDKVVYEHPSSSDDNEEAQHSTRVSRKTTKANARRQEDKKISGALSSWAGMGSASFLSRGSSTEDGPVTAAAAAVTSDGRPPLHGFVLGGGNQGTGGGVVASKQKQFFRGPTVPANWTIKPHVFGPNDHPMILKTLSHAEQLHAQEERKRAVVREALQSNAVAVRASLSAAAAVIQEPPAATTNQPLAGSAFTGLREQMKNRFTGGSSSTSSTTTAATGKNGNGAFSIARAPGLSQPQQPKRHPQEEKQQQQQTREEETNTKEKVKLVRTVQSFAPTALLCKRFNVPRLRSAAAATAQPPAAMDGRSVGQEEAFFAREILKAKEEHQQQRWRQQHPTPKAEHHQQQHDEQGEEEETTTKPQRPCSLSVYKSIYEPASEDSSSSSSSSEDGVDDDDDNNNNQAEPASSTAEEGRQQSRMTNATAAGEIDRGGNSDKEGDKLVPPRDEDGDVGGGHGNGVGGSGRGYKRPRSSSLDGATHGGDNEDEEDDASSFSDGDDEKDNDRGNGGRTRRRRRRSRRRDRREERSKERHRSSSRGRARDDHDDRDTDNDDDDDYYRKKKKKRKKQHKSKKKKARKKSAERNEPS